jgi:hypothetical protein
MVISFFIFLLGLVLLLRRYLIAEKEAARAARLWRKKSETAERPV